MTAIYATDFIELMSSMMYTVQAEIADLALINRF